jgi:glycosyltransferase involved in cell wall biosynthesis
MKRTKILHLNGSLDLGGAEKLTRMTVEGLDPGRFEASVCCLKAGGFYADQLQRNGYQVDTLLGVDKSAGITVSLLLKAAWKLYRLLRREQPDILHSHLFAASCLGRLVGRAAGVRRFVVTLHRIEYPRVQPFLERLFARLTTLYTTDSHAAADNLSKELGIPRDKIRVIYNGIDRGEFEEAPDRDRARHTLGVAPSEFIIGIVAHLVPAKGISFFLTALAGIRHKLGDLKVLIVGDGVLRLDLEAQAGQLFASGIVQFLGQRGDLALLLSAMDILVLPSSWEGFGLILAEAMYMRVPVITTSDGGGCAEVVGNDDGGLLVLYGDTAALGSAILRLYDDPAYRCEQGRRGRDRVERLFTSETMIRQYESTYAKMGASGSCAR